jgi:hypothetical protein
VTPALLFARRLIIQWVTVWVTPFEFTFDMIDAHGDLPVPKQKSVPLPF